MEMVGGEHSSQKRARSGKKEKVSHDLKRKNKGIKRGPNEKL